MLNECYGRAVEYRGNLRWPKACIAACALASAVGLLLAAAAQAEAYNAYVTNAGVPDNVSVIDTATNAQAAPAITVGTDPAGVAITPDGRRAYVANQGGGVTVIDTSTNTTVGAPIPVGTAPTDVAIAPNGARAYVTNFTSNFISIIDTATNTTLAEQIPVGANAKRIAITPDGTRAYVLVGGIVRVVDLATNTVVGPPIAVGTDPNEIAITPGGTRAYVPNQNSSNVSMIDLATNTTTATIPLPVEPSAIAITPDGSRAYVTTGNNDVRVIDLTTNTVSGAPIPVGNGADAVGITPDGARVYVANRLVDNLSVINTATNSVIGGTVPVGDDPQDIAIVPGQPPNAAFTHAPDPAAAGPAVQFDGNGSTDSDGTVARFDWDFGDGTTAPDAGPTPTHAYGPGTYEARLTVTDNTGCSTALVFTGQTAYCNGSGVATTTRTITVDGSGPSFDLAGKKRQKLHATADVKVADTSEQASVEGNGDARRGRQARQPGGAEGLQAAKRDRPARPGRGREAEAEAAAQGQARRRRRLRPQRQGQGEDQRLRDRRGRKRNDPSAIREASPAPPLRRRARDDPLLQLLPR